MFPDIDACRAAARWAQQHAAELSVTIVRSGATAWRWRMEAGGAVVAVASRDYQRRIQAAQAAAVVLGLLAGAELGEMPVRVRI
ncbi:nucleoid-associated protein YgaU [Actinoplanes lutulentus]|uniref:DUF1508 domain-containing protein n=1 Tax=Actinoplanes lutulentus TaxID=1287878 RepID=A0A327ZLW8_9ACTN|nr:hypothetical protein [Actinoplanes lutulentus]MBB2941086.1 nucleoid-associated protein YgaU [Actinoplanes lutulentus]RAK43395.1 hypothetical protein B0I29_101525 [Actinoplanes lutulentus]